MIMSLCRIHGVFIFFVLLACMGLSVWAFTAGLVPKAEKLLDGIIRLAASTVPEITVRNGKAAIKAEEPFHIKIPGAESVMVMIDTREGRREEILRELAEVEDGAVLTRDSIIIKNNRQTRIVPLNKEMNLVINAGTLTQLKKTYFPTVVAVVTGAAGVYFLLAKLLQALLMALVPYVVGERSSEPLSYGNS
ncbi:MAG: DUF1189 family protein, partial [Pseudomonadota bacterium]